MREMSVIVKRVQCGLSISREEHQALDAFLEQRRASNSRDNVFIGILGIMVVLIGMAFVLGFK